MFCKNNNDKKDNKSFDNYKVNYDAILCYAIDHFFDYGFKPNRLKTVPIFNNQLKSNSKRIVLEKSFFKQNKLLRSDLMHLPLNKRSQLLVTAFSAVFKTDLQIKEVVIR